MRLCMWVLGCAQVSASRGTAGGICESGGGGGGGGGGGRGVVTEKSETKFTKLMGEFRVRDGQGRQSSVGQARRVAVQS